MGGFKNQSNTAWRHTIQDEWNSLTKRTNLNFVWAWVTVTDWWAGPNSTIVTIPWWGWWWWSSSWVAGSIQFSDWASGFSSDWANFFYDDTNNRLWIWTNTPWSPLHIVWRVYQTWLWDSTFFGFEAWLNDDLSSNINTAFGYQAMRANTTGYQNVAIWTQSLYSNTTWFSNVGLGYYSLWANTTWYYNIAIWTQSLYSNTTWAGNMAFGFQSMVNNTTWQFNCSIGYANLWNNTTWSNNVAIWTQNLNTSSTSNNNTAIGYQNLLNTTWANNVGIWTANLLTLTTWSDNIWIWTYSLYYSTTAIYNTALNYQSLYYNTTGDYWIWIGYRALFNNTTWDENIGIWSYAWTYTQAGANNQTSNNSIYIWYDTRSWADWDSNEVVIWYWAVGNWSNTITLGNSSMLRLYTAGLNLRAWTATAGTAPLKFTTWTNLTTPEAWVFEYNNTPHFTNSDWTRRHIILSDWTYTAWVVVVGWKVSVNIWGSSYNLLVE